MKKQNRKERIRLIFFIGVLPFLAGILVPVGLWPVSILVLFAFGYFLDQEFREL